MGITQKKIAEMLGVSTATVSMALNDSVRLSPETKRRVRELAAEGRYRPDLSARGLITGRSNTIGIIVGTFRSPFYGELVGDMQMLLRERGYMGISIPAEAYGRGAEAVDALLSHRVDGIISITLSADELSRIRGEGVPAVIYGESDGPSVYLDEYAGAKLATEHLIGTGGRSFAYIGRTGEGDRRCEGFRDALRSHGMDTEARCVADIQDATRAVNGYEAMKALLHDNTPDSVVCRNDIIALGVIRALQEAGRSIPNDTAVTGFDDSDICNVMPVALTSIAVNARAIAEALIETLFSVMEQKPVTNTVITPTLVTRESTARSRSAQ